MQFSVVIPTFNSSQTVSATIQSALGTVPSGSEVIVVDDGSEDGTSECVERCRASVEQAGMTLRFIQLAHSGNVSALRNVGARAGSKETLVFLDSDVELSRQWCPSIEKFLYSYPQAGCVGGLVYSKGQPAHIYNSGMSFSGRLSRSLYILRPAVVSSDPYVVEVVSNVFAIRRASFESVRGFNEEIAWMGDETWLQLSLQSRSLQSYVVPSAVSWHARNLALPFKSRILTYSEARHTGVFLEPFLVQRDFLGGTAYAVCVLFNLVRLTAAEAVYFAGGLFQGRPDIATRRLRNSLSLGLRIVKGLSREHE